MNYRTFEWRLSDGVRLFACEWTPDGAARGVVAIVHGMGEHTGRYSHVAGMLTEAGYAVYGFDQRGHGRSDGQRGHTPSYEALLEGVDFMLRDAEAQYPGRPLFLYGHSMGGNIVLNYLLRRKPKVAGAIVTSPWLTLAFNPPPLNVVVGRMLERIRPTFTNNRPLIPERLTSDPDMIRQLREDPLGHGQITASFFFGVRRAGLWALEHADELTVPLLLMHGGDDKVTSFESSARFARRAGPLCTFKEWPGFKHELHNEAERERVFETILAWLNKRTG